MIGARRHLLELAALTAEEIQQLLDLADTFSDISRRPIKKVPTLRGRTIVNLFMEPSTRTRSSFELAAKRLSADTLNISGMEDKINKLIEDLKAAFLDVKGNMEHLARVEGSFNAHVGQAFAQVQGEFGKMRVVVGELQKDRTLTAHFDMLARQINAVQDQVNDTKKDQTERFQCRPCGTTTPTTTAQGV